MKMRSYEDYKYVMGDTSCLYLGGKFSYEETLEDEAVPFKFQAVIRHYLLKDTAPDTTLESQFYYMAPDSFSYKTFEQLKAKVKVCELEEKRNLFGKVSRRYVQRVYPLKEFVGINLAQKKKRGVVVQEIALSRLSLSFFDI